MKHSLSLLFAFLTLAAWPAHTGARAAASAAGKSADKIPAQVSEGDSGRAADLLAALAAYFRNKSSYEVEFIVAAGDDRVQGRYAVAGDDYHIAAGDAEVFAEGDMRREVDNRRREVTLTEAETSSRNMLSNPARAFDLLTGACRPELLRESGGRAAVRLNSVPGISGTVTVTLETATGRPLELLYDYDGEQISVAIVRIADDVAIPKFDPARYTGYEVIDFR